MTFFRRGSWVQGICRYPPREKFQPCLIWAVDGWDKCSLVLPVPGAVSQLWEPRSCASAIHINASSPLSTDQCCLWTSSCSGGSCLPRKIDVETDTDWCMFSFASNMKKMMALLSVATMGVFYIYCFTCFLSLLSVSTWKIRGKWILMRCWKLRVGAGNCKAQGREGSCMR